MKKAGKKPILGCELYVSEYQADDRTPENKKLSHQVVLAKNLNGWRSLIRLVSESNHPDRFYYKPRVDYDLMATYCYGDIISFSGHLGSTLANYILDEKELKTDWLKIGSAFALEIQDMFGKGNFFIEIQRIDAETNIKARQIAECMRAIAAETKIPCVATPDAHYCKKEDADDHRVLLATNIQKTLREIYQEIRSNPDASLSSFFTSNKYHIPDIEEMLDIHEHEELFLISRNYLSIRVQTIRTQTSMSKNYVGLAGES
jgi:DNA polymerase-3 subunit alpha